MLKPAFLQPGDKVALISPAGILDDTTLPYAIRLLESWGLIPVVGKNALARNSYFAGTDQQRRDDLQWALDAEDIRAVFCNRGGYGTIRIIDDIDFSNFQGNPKWIVGFSDITVLHAKINSLGFESIHGPMPKTFRDTSNEAMEKLKDFLFGKITSYSLPAHPFNVDGIVRAELIGGNLTVVQSLLPTKECYSHNEPVLFLEDINEPLYAVDRCMQSLVRSHRFETLQGLIVGQFTNIDETNFGCSTIEAIHQLFKDYEIPICFNFPAGHSFDNFPLILGNTIELYIENKRTEINFL